MKLLFLSRWFPWPSGNGSKLRIYNLLRGIAQHHDVTLLSFSEQLAEDVANLSELSFCSDVRLVPWRTYQPGSWRAMQGLLRDRPRSLVDTFSSEMQQQIEQTITSDDPDLIIASQGAMADYGQYFHGRPAIYEEVELALFLEQYTRAETIPARVRHGLTWFKHRSYLSRQLSHFQACTVVSEQEHELLNRTIPNYSAVEVMPNCVNLEDYPQHHTAQADTLIFTGSFRYQPNYDAMVWFLREIFPIVRATIPGVQLKITGDHANLPLPEIENVTVTGFVDDVRPLIAEAWVSLAPLRVGGGTRLKILEAMASGTPVVATSKGAEGLAVRSGEQILIADTPDEYAHAIIRLCRTPDLRQEMATRARAFVARNYDWATTMPRFLQLLDDVVRTKGQSSSTETRYNRRSALRAGSG